MIVASRYSISGTMALRGETGPGTIRRPVIFQARKKTDIAST